MKWKIVLGILIIFGAASEMFSIIGYYRTRKIRSWPFGADIACILLIILGLHLIRKGMKPKKLS